MTENIQRLTLLWLTIKCCFGMVVLIAMSTTLVQEFIDNRRGL